MTYEPVGKATGTCLQAGGEGNRDLQVWRDRLAAIRADYRAEIIT